MEERANEADPTPPPSTFHTQPSTFALSSRSYIIRPQVPKDDDAVLSLFRANFPQFPHDSLEDYRAREQSLVKYGRTFRTYVADVYGEVVGQALLLDIKTNQPGQFWIEIQVRSDHRRRGLGTLLLDTLLNDSRELGAARVLSEYLDSDDGSGKLFALNRGFQPNGGHGETLSRLDVQKANLEGFEDAETVIRNHGISIERMAELDLDRECLRQIYRLDMDTHRDVPSPVEWVDIPYDEWLEVVINGPGRSPEWSWIALEGNKPIGIARLRVSGNEGARNTYTGVRTEYRGRGVARALKNRTVLWCRDNKVSYIFTGNSVHNQRMLAINMSLGYELLPASVEVIKELV